jgi:subtilisin-like proprotein convertase family protein
MGVKFSASANNLPVGIPDASSISIPIVVSTNTTIADVNVRLNISHARVGDLVIQLRSPNGTKITLSNRRGGNGSGYSNTTFDDAATRGISGAASPFGASFKPETSLAAFNGGSTQGTWTLIVADAVRGSIGRVNSVTLDFNTPNATTTVRKQSIDVDQRADIIITQLPQERPPFATPSQPSELRAETRRLLGGAEPNVMVREMKVIPEAAPRRISVGSTIQRFVSDDDRLEL